MVDVDRVASALWEFADRSLAGVAIFHSVTRDAIDIGQLEVAAND